jgi:hypothetical protein
MSRLVWAIRSWWMCGIRMLCEFLSLNLSRPWLGVILMGGWMHAGMDGGY